MSPHPALGPSDPSAYHVLGGGQVALVTPWRTSVMHVVERANDLGIQEGHRLTRTDCKHSNKYLLVKVAIGHGRFSPHIRKRH